MKAHYKQDLSWKEQQLIKKISRQRKRGETMGIVKKIAKGAGIILFGLYALERCQPEEVALYQHVEPLQGIESVIADEPEKLYESRERQTFRGMDDLLSQREGLYDCTRRYV